jgi:pimeloyl-ACP methyl ester carboxylesterase
MHEEALDVLSRLLEELGLRRPFLVGHSDGASIALIHAASGAPVAGLALLAPHVMVEEITVRSIARVTELYWSGDLRDRMARHHANVDDAFLGWSDIWLAPEFCTWSLAEEVGRLRAPALLIQGEDDEYGTLAQLDLIERLAPVRPARLVLARAGHSPHRDQPAATNDAICGFARGFLSS